VAAERVSPSIPSRSKKSAPKVLSREVTGICVPDGTPITLPKDSTVYITQALGSSFTVAIDGRLIRIDGEDGDALGEEKKGLLDQEILNAELGTKTIKKILKTVFDPEIPVNILDLGLIYDIQISSSGSVTIAMTLTAPGCGMGEVLVQEVKMKLKKHPLIQGCQVNLVFDPPWDRTMLSTTAKLELGLL